MSNTKQQLHHLFEEAKALEATGYTEEQRTDMVARARPLIKQACHEQYQETGGVFPPSYCRVCREGCAIGVIVTTLDRK